jgi:hypothetical protein
MLVSFVSLFAAKARFALVIHASGPQNGLWLCSLAAAAHSPHADASLLIAAPGVPRNIGLRATSSRVARKCEGGQSFERVFAVLHFHNSPTTRSSIFRYASRLRGNALRCSVTQLEWDFVLSCT